MNYKINLKTYGKGYRLSLSDWIIEVIPIKKNKKYNITILENFEPIKDIDLFASSIEDAKNIAIGIFEKYLIDLKSKIDNVLEEINRYV